MTPMHLKLSFHLRELSKTILHGSDEPVTCPIIQMSDEVVVGNGYLVLTYLRIDRYRFPLEAVVFGFVRSANVIGFGTFNDHCRCSADICAYHCERHGHLSQRIDCAAQSVNGDSLRYKRRLGD